MRLGNRREAALLFLGPILLLASATAIRAERLVIFDAPGASGTPVSSGTWSMGINASGDITGFFWDGINNHSFVRNPAGGLTVFDAPNATPRVDSGEADGTVSYSINDRGDVTGYFFDASQNYKVRGFVRDRLGKFAVFDAPNAGEATISYCINARGEVAGYFVDRTQPNNPRGFVRDRSGSLTVFDIPNASGLQPTSINNSGDVTGIFWDVAQGNKIRGFVRFEDTARLNDDQNNDQ